MCRVGAWRNVQSDTFVINFVGSSERERASTRTKQVGEARRVSLRQLGRTPRVQMNGRECRASSVGSHVYTWLFLDNASAGVSAFDGVDVESLGLCTLPRWASESKSELQIAHTGAEKGLSDL